MNQFKSWLILNRNSEYTSSTYLYEVNKFLLSYKELNQETLNSYLEQTIKEGKKESTFNIIMSALKSYAQYLEIELKFPKQKTPHKVSAIERVGKWAITYEELQVILKYSQDLFDNDYKEYELLLTFMFFTGLRLKEVCQLRVVDLNWDKEIVEVRRTKGKVDRLIPFLNEKFFQDLKRHLNTRTNEVYNGVFKLNRNQIAYAFTKIKENFSWDEFSPVFMRRSFARYCHKRGLAKENIQTLLGHSDIKTTEHYLGDTTEDFLNACNKIKI